MNEYDVNDHKGITRKHGSKVLRIIGMAVIGVAFAVVFALIFGLLVKVLWNWLMPMIFGLKVITFWQAFGIVLLAKLLFGGFGPHNKDHDNHFHRRISDKWHRFNGFGDPDKHYGSPVGKKWDQYRRFWQDEGKTAFEEYLRRMEDEKEK